MVAAAANETATTPSSGDQVNSSELFPATPKGDRALLIRSSELFSNTALVASPCGHSHLGWSASESGTNMAAQVPLPLFVRVVFAHETAKSSFLLSHHAISPRSTRFAGFALTTVWQCFHAAEDRTATPSPAATPQHQANWHLGVAAPRSRCDESPSCTPGNTLKVRPTCPTLFPHRPCAATHGEVRPLRPSSSALSKGTSVYSVLEMPHK